MRNGFDVSEIMKFNEKLQSESYQMTLFMKMIREVGNELLKELQKNTPVDTGQLKNSYEIQTAMKIGKDYELNIVNKARVQRGTKAGQASYASWVEEGHRLVINGQELGYIEGRFFMRNTINEFEQKKLISILKKNMIEWFERCAQ